MANYDNVRATVHEIHKLENCVVIITYIDHQQKFVTICISPSEYRAANLRDGSKLEIKLDKKTGKPKQVLHIEKLPLSLLKERDPDEPYNCEHEYA